jgi:hypothetical protein
MKSKNLKQIAVWIPTRELIDKMAEQLTEKRKRPVTRNALVDEAVRALAQKEGIEV